MEVLKIIKKQYFLEDNLEWTVNPKFQLSDISGCRDIANSKMHQIYRPQFKSVIFSLIFMLQS